jgi:hypothetical protein
MENTQSRTGLVSHVCELRYNMQLQIQNAMAIEEVKQKECIQTLTQHTRRFREGFVYIRLRTTEYATH